MIFEWRDKYIMLLSLFLAVVLWFYVVSDRNPLTEQVFSIPLQPRNLASELAVEGLPGTVDIRVKGNRAQLAALGGADFRAQVDLTGVTQGQAGLPVEVISPTGVQISSVRPSRVEVTVDRLVEKQVTVLVNLKGNPAAGFVAGSPVLEPAVVLAKGPSRWVEEVRQVAVTVDLEGVNDVVDTVVSVSSGLEKVNLIPGTVRVVVPVAALQRVPVAINPRFTGSPAPGYHVTRVTVAPENVNVLVDPEVTEAIGPVDTEPINLSGIEASLTRQVKVLAPPGSKGIEPEQVEVTVHVELVAEPDDEVDVPPEEH